MTKICSCCGEEKNAKHFSKDKFQCFTCKADKYMMRKLKGLAPINDQKEKVYSLFIGKFSGLDMYFN